MSVLKEICEKKLEHVAARKALLPFEDLREIAQDTPPPRPFIKALQEQDGTAIIAEVKKASPSKGIIRKDFDPAQIARDYEDAGATCLSVLTDTPYFQGSDEYFRQVRESSSLPMLRKDFMIDPYQIYESCVLGADCVLLIMAMLTYEQAQELYFLSVQLGMDVLVEVHDAFQLKHALEFNPQMIGINNRNLKTLEVDVQTSYNLVSDMPDWVVKIAESGIDSRETIKNLERTGFNGFLIGESLMRQSDVKAALTKLLA